MGATLASTPVYKGRVLTAGEVSTRYAAGAATGGVVSTLSGTSSGQVNLAVQSAGSAGSADMFSLQPTINQSGTAGYTGFKLNVTESTVGSGSKNLVDIQKGSVSTFKIGNTGDVLAKSLANSTTAFQVQNASGQSILLADTTNGQLAVGPAAATNNAVLTIGSNTTTSSGGIAFGSDTNTAAANQSFVSSIGTTPMEMATDGTYLYWRVSGGNIARSNIDGTNVNTSFAAVGCGNSGIAVDSNYIYYNCSGNNTIGRVSIDGSTGMNANWLNIVSNSNMLAVDGNYIYYSILANGTIGRATLAGTGINNSFINVNGSGGSAFALTTDSNYIYWTDYTLNTIGRAPIGGGSPTVNFITGANMTNSTYNGIAVNGSNIYWTNNNNNTIGRANLNGTGASQSFITGANVPNGLALTSTYLYWVNDGNSTIGRYALSGTTSATNLYRSAAYTLKTDASLNVQTANNSATAFQLQSSNADVLFVADTTANRLTVGNATAASGADTTLFVLDSAATTNAPTGVAGGLYYDTTIGAFRVYSGGSYQSVCTVSNGLCTSGGAFANGGNSFGSASSLGNNDNNNLTIRINGASGAANGGTLALQGSTAGTNNSGAGGIGGAITLTAGNGGIGNNTLGVGAGGNGGAVTITSGNGGNSSSNSGNGGVGGAITLQAGTGGGGSLVGAASNGGTVTINGGTGGTPGGNTAGGGGGVVLNGGNAAAAGVNTVANGGGITLTGGTGSNTSNANTTGNGGTITLTGGAAGTSTGGGASGSQGYVLLQPSGGFVGIGTNAPTRALQVSATAAVAAKFNRSNDGSVVEFSSGGTVQGDISISGATVSYNAFTGSHYALTNDTLNEGEIVTNGGVASYFHGATAGEPLYQVSRTQLANDPNVLGSFLQKHDADQPQSVDNPNLIAAVGNGEVWIVDNGQPVTAGSYLISSDEAGHGMVDDGSFPVSHIFAKVAENVDWSQVTTTVNGRKHVKVSVFYGFFDKTNNNLQNQNLNIQSLQAQTATVDSLNVSGNATINNLTVQTITVNGDLTVQGIAHLQDIEVGGHIITAGGQPVGSILGSAGANATVTIDGTDTTGTITITTGDTTSAGDLAKIIFSKTYGKAPHVVISSSNLDASGLRYFKGVTNLTDFTLTVGNAPAPHTTYQFDYFIAQ